MQTTRVHFCLILFYFLKTVCHCVALMAWDSLLCTPGWPWTHRGPPASASCIVSILKAIFSSANSTETRVPWGRGGFSRGMASIRLACRQVYEAFSWLMWEGHTHYGLWHPWADGLGGSKKGSWLWAWEQASKQSSSMASASVPAMEFLQELCSGRWNKTFTPEVGFGYGTCHSNRKHTGPVPKSCSVLLLDSGCSGTNQLFSYTQRVSFRMSLPQRTGGSGMPGHLTLCCE